MARLPLLLAFLFVIACMPFATAATSSGDRDDLKVEIRNEVLSELRQLLAKSAAPPQSGPSPARTASQPVVLNAAGERKRSVSDSGPMQRRRRFLSDTSAVKEIMPVPNYIAPDRRGGVENRNVRNSPEYIPTTAAQAWTFFRVTDQNSEVKRGFFGTEFTLDTCLAAVAYQRCVDSTCTQLTRNNVAQKVYAWEPEYLRWLETGPGATGPSAGSDFPSKYRPIVANGVRALAHFSPDGVHDFVVPASFDEDVTAAATSNPTQQCGDVWRYRGASVGFHGYVKYQDCAWSGQGTRHVAAFKMFGEQFLVHTSMVDRRYTNGTLMSERYRSQPNFILKWSSRFFNNQGLLRPQGFFLSGGEALLEGETLQPSDPAYNSAIGNNGANTFQNFYNLTGVVHAETMEILGQHLIGFSEYVANDDCPSSGAADPSEVFPACWDVEIESHIYMYNPGLSNPRGDCTAANTPAGCQEFKGEFELLQALPTKGARSMHFFSLESTAQRAYFLAVAESHDNTGETVTSSLWRWNGRAFGLHQRLDTSFAQSFTTFTVSGSTFLVVANRGCPDLERAGDSVECNRSDQGGQARARIWRYEPTADLFQQVTETLESGTLHALGFDGVTPEAGKELAIEGVSQLATGVTAFSLEFSSFFGGESETVTFVAVANAAVRQTDAPRPANMFSIATSDSAGIATRVAEIGLGANDNALYLESINTKLTGGNGLYLNLRRDTSAAMRLFGAAAATTFLVGAQRYVVIGFDRAYHTPEQCLAHYANASSPTAVCAHLPLADRAVASPAACELTCSTVNPGTVESLPFADRRTETLVYRLEERTAPDGTALQPELNITQRLPSLGVAGLHVFQQTDAVSQAAYEACTDRGAAACYLNDAAPRNSGLFLAVLNSASSCEQAADGRRLPPDPARRVAIYRWSAENDTFAAVTTLENTTCQVRAVHHFTTACQTVAGLDVDAPTCANYLAVAEDCREDNAYRAENGLPHLGTPMRVSFHRWDAASKTYRHCQPYEDPGDERNAEESPCFQPADLMRASGLVLPGDEHFFDFPDLLPADLRVGLNLTDDGSGLYTQLAGSDITGLDFGIPLAQKDVFYRNADTDRSNNLISDNDTVNRTIYYLNGRAHYEQVFSVTYDARAAPQVFGLAALAKRSAACATRHATTPRRREFRLVQALATTGGGRAVRTFTRQSLVGVPKMYAVFPERNLRPGQFRRNELSSVYVNSVCDEFGQYTLSQAASDPVIPFGGLTAPQAVNLPAGDTEWCPYSVDIDHYNAWEDFENYYNPVSPCKGRTTNPTGTSFQYEQLYYNRAPPAVLLGFRDVMEPAGKFTWRRPPGDSVILSSQGYSFGDYRDLFESRDDPLVKLQDLPSANPLNVAVEELCGTNGQLWLIFASEGSAPTLASFRKRLLFIWRDRYAAAFDPVTNARTACTAAAARTALQTAEPEIAELGCFEQVRLTLPANNPETVDALVFTAGDFLFFAFINSRAATRDSPLFKLTHDADACAAVPGMSGTTSPVATASLAAFGGLQCRTVEVDLSGLNVDIDSIGSEAIESLRSEFVTLDTDQVITGRKTFNASVTARRGLTVAEDLVVTGETELQQGLVVNGNIDTLGFINNIDVASFAAAQLRFGAQVTQRLASLEAAVCRFDGEVGSLNSVVFGVNASAPSSAFACAAMVFRTACFPLAGLLPAASAALKDVFAGAVQAQLTAFAANATSVQFFTGSPLFYTVLRAGDGVSAAQLLSASEAVSLASFTDARYCGNSSVPPSPPGVAFVARRLNFVFLDCKTVAAETIRTLRMVIADFLRAYGVRPTDVVILSTGCGDFVVRFYVAVADIFSNLVRDEFDSPEYWTLVYAELVAFLPALFADVDEALEYIPGLFVPEGASGSGSGASG